MLSLSVSLIWLLAMLAAAIQLRDASRNLAGAVVLLATFVGVFPLAIWLSPQPNWIGVLLTVGIIWRLIEGPKLRLANFRAGATAALAGALPMAGGVEFWLAGGLTAVAVFAAFWLRPQVPMPAHRNEIVLVCVAIAVPVLALLGDLVFGWRSATVLNRDTYVAEFALPPGWALAVVGFAFFAGLVRGIWIKK